MRDPQHNQQEHVLVEDAIQHVMLPTVDDPATPEHRLIFMLNLMNRRLDALPERIAEALNGNGKSKWTKVKEKAPPVIGWSSLFGIFLGIAKVL
jgi:hypothetical protein